MSNVRPRKTHRMPACLCSHPSPSRGPSVNLGRRTIAVRQAARPVRSGRLPVFAVSEPWARLTQDTLAYCTRLSRYRAVRIEQSSAGVAATPMPLRDAQVRHPRPPKPVASARKVAVTRLNFGRHPPVLRTGSNASAHAGYGVGLCTLQGCHATEPREEFGALAGTTVSSLSFRSRRHSKPFHKSAARPNPSIEGTCNIWLRQLSAAPHVKR